jgi:hypothetical protein
MSQPIPVIFVFCLGGQTEEVTFSSTSAAKRCGYPTNNSMEANFCRYYFPADWDFEAKVRYIEQFAPTI